MWRSLSAYPKNVPRVFLQNFGCRASQADGAALDALLRQQGYEATNTPDAADWVVLNTCTVTATADADVRHAVRRAHQANPNARIAVTGCYAQRAPQEIAALPGVELVVGNSHKTQLVDLLSAGSQYHGQIHVGDFARDAEFLATPVEGPGVDRARPNLKIQDGCSNKCSFCIIPSVRGRSRSAPLDQVLQQVRHLAAQSSEIVLTGINLGRWGRENSRLRLVDLLRILLDETPVQRLRLSSIEPMDWSEDLLQLMASTPRIARHVHAPLQSGSDTVLRRMARKYRTRHYRSRIERARELAPDCAIGADVMTGFPGETAGEFQQTLDFIEALPFSYLHVFTYSEREGTAAATASDQVPMHERRQRTRILRELSLRKQAEFWRSQSGRRLSVAVLRSGVDGLSSNYIPVRLAKPRPAGTLAEVQVTWTQDGMRENAAELLPVLA